MSTKLACLLITGVLSAQPLFRPATVSAEPVWPHSIPCRIQDSDNNDLFIMTLGDVATGLAQGTFDPQKDEVRMSDGTVKEHYYRDTLGVKYYQPLDKSRFPLPPSGWCTWYYYYPRITATEVKRNAKWIAENLKDYGAEYVQIDDGWQGAGGRDGGRDWSVVNPERFPDEMKDLAEYIRSVGLKPGIWIAPHGQSNPAVVDANPNVFMLRPNGASASETWEGRWLIDPTTPESTKYVKDLFQKLSEWGYVYYKIDGQPIVANEYRTKTEFMKKPAELPSDLNELYRNTLATMRSAIGDEAYLLGCWGIPVEGMGIMNGSRTGGDIVRGWEGGFGLAARATLEHYYLHNVAWYCDPDTMLLRSPLPVEQARAWATLQGLTGQALMGSDRLMDLSAERVDMLKRVCPAVDIRPLDLFPSRNSKRIWDLKVNHLDRKYDVVGLFNHGQEKAEQINLKWADLGLSGDQPIHVFDFWNGDYLGAWEAGMMVDVPPASVRVLTLLPSLDRPQLISTNRHITQGWVDLVELTYDEAATAYTGKSRVIRGDPYELRFVFPRKQNFTVKSATGKTVSSELQATVSNHQGWAKVAWTPSETTEVSWRVEFEPTDAFYYRPEPVENLRVALESFGGVRLSWNELYWLNAGYQVYLDGELLGYTPRSTFVINDLDPAKSYKVAVATVWDDGSVSQRRAETTVSLASLLPNQISLRELKPIRASRGFRGGPRTDASVSIAGQRYDGSIAMGPGSEIEYELKGVFAKFKSAVGLDNGVNGEREVEFVVEGDDKELWRSGLLKKADGLKPVNVDVSGVRKLVLRVTGQGDRRSGQRRSPNAAAWVDARLLRTGETPD